MLVCWHLPKPYETSASVNKRDCEHGAFLGGSNRISGSLGLRPSVCTQLAIAQLCHGVQRAKPAFWHQQYRRGVQSRGRKSAYCSCAGGCSLFIAWHRGTCCKPCCFVKARLPDPGGIQPGQQQALTAAQKSQGMVGVWGLCARAPAPQHRGSGVARVSARGTSTCGSEAGRKRIFPGPFASVRVPAGVRPAAAAARAAALRGLVLQNGVHSLGTSLASAVRRASGRSPVRERLLKGQAAAEKRCWGRQMGGEVRDAGGCG